MYSPSRPLRSQVQQNAQQNQEREGTQRPNLWEISGFVTDQELKLARGTALGCFMIT